MCLGEALKSGADMAGTGILSSSVYSAHFTSSYEKAKMFLQVVQCPKRAGMC